MGLFSKISKKASSISESLGIVGEFMEFLWRKKLLWMIPVFLLLVLIGAVIIFAQSSALSPFVYALV